MRIKTIYFIGESFSTDHKPMKKTSPEAMSLNFIPKYCYGITLLATSMNLNLSGQCLD